MAVITLKRKKQDGSITIRHAFDYYDHNGKRHRKSFKSYDLARKFEIKVLAELQQGTHIAHSQIFKKIANDYVNKVQANRRTKSTWRDYDGIIRNYLNPVFGDRVVTSITKGEVNKFLDTVILTSGLTDCRIARIKFVFGAVMDYAVAYDYLIHNVVKDIKLVKQTRIDEDAEDSVIIPTLKDLKLIAACAGLSMEDKVLIQTSLFTGVRSSELFAQAWKYIDLEKGLFLVRRRVDQWRQLGRPKTKESRRDIPMPDHLVGLLKEWYSCCGQPDGEALVFANKEGKLHQRGNWNLRHWIPYLEKLKLGHYEGSGKDKKFYPRYQFRHLRHAYASLLIRNNTNAKVIQANMGHEDISTTFKHYGRLFSDDADRYTAVNAAVKMLL